MGFYVTGALYSCATSRVRWLILPSVWYLVSLAGDRVFGLPIYVSIALTQAQPNLLYPATLFGAIGLEFLVLCVNTILAAIFQREHGHLAATVIVCLFVSGALASVSFEAVQVSGRAVSIRLLQPSLGHEEIRRTEWSLASRLSRESIYDELTLQAAREGAGIVLWPEGGNGLPNARLRRRQAFLRGITEKSGVVIFAAGPDLAPDGKRFNVVHHIEDGEFVATAKKSMLVRFSETALSKGIPRVFNTKYGRFGISICYDGIFYSHMRRLVEEGADVLMVVSNDSSFGLTATPFWHAAYARLLGVEVGRPVVFLSNNGVASVSDAYGELQFFEMSSGFPEIQNVSLTIPDVAEARPNMRLFPLFICVPLLLHLIRRRASRAGI